MVLFLEPLSKGYGAAVVAAKSRTSFVVLRQTLGLSRLKFQPCDGWTQVRIRLTVDL